MTKRHLFCFVYLKSYDTPTHIWRDRVSYISIRVFVIIKNDEKDFNALPETVFSIRLSLSLSAYITRYTVITPNSFSTQHVQFIMLVLYMQTKKQQEVMVEQKTNEFWKKTKIK